MSVARLCCFQRCFCGRETLLATSTSAERYFRLPICTHYHTLVSGLLRWTKNLWWDGAPRNAAQQLFSLRALSWHFAAPVTFDRFSCYVQLQRHTVKSHHGTRRSHTTPPAPPQMQRCWSGRSPVLAASPRKQRLPRRCAQFRSHPCRC